MNAQSGIPAKSSVKSHWEQETCGVRYGEGESEESRLREMEKARYTLEPEIPGLARFSDYQGKDVLEIGVGGGVDHLSWYKGGANVYGIDLTEAGIAITERRLKMHGFDSAGKLKTGDAENLQFSENRFDLVYSYGVLHHTPDTQKAFSEAFRVLKPGGELRAMIYHHPSWVGLMLYFYHGLLRGRVFVSMKQIVFEHLESPGTKTYTVAEAEDMLRGIGYTDIKICPRLSVGDFMELKLSGKYASPVFRLMQVFYPRFLVKLLGHGMGLNLFITASKPGIAQLSQS